MFTVPPTSHGILAEASYLTTPKLVKTDRVGCVSILYTVINGDNKGHDIFDNFYISTAGGMARWVLFLNKVFGEGAELPFLDNQGQVTGATEMLTKMTKLGNFSLKVKVDEYDRDGEMVKTNNVAYAGWNIAKK